MTTLVHLRIASNPWKGDSGKEHSYYVGHEAGGLTERLDTLAIRPDSTTLRHLREQLEEQRDGNTIRRRPFYTELLQFMQRCPNPLGYPDEAKTTYRIGVLKMKDAKSWSPTLKDIHIIKKDAETKPILEVVDELIGTDVVLIPLAQIHPVTDRLSDHL